MQAVECHLKPNKYTFPEGSLQSRCLLWAAGVRIRCRSSIYGVGVEHLSAEIYRLDANTWCSRYFEQHSRMQTCVCVCVCVSRIGMNQKER